MAYESERSRLGDETYEPPSPHFRDDQTGEVYRVDAPIEDIPDVYLLMARRYDGPVGPTSDRPMVTSVRVVSGPAHDIIHIWNRGGKSGTLTVNRGDGLPIAKRLFGSESYTVERGAI